MFDLSTAGKSRSRLGKFKDKVRGKKKELDSSSDVVPSLTKVLTDSEEEDASGGREGGLGKGGKSKPHKMISLFSPKSNLQRNMSQSMSVLPAKNSSLSGSQSSGLNVDSSEGRYSFSVIPPLTFCVTACILIFPICFQVKRSSSSRYINTRVAPTANNHPRTSKNRSRAIYVSTAAMFTVRSRRLERLASDPALACQVQDVDPWRMSQKTRFNLWIPLKQ